MPIEFRKHITREMLRAEPQALFVFGDNLARQGFGGQAKEMRGEPNAIGLPTKANPGVTAESYLRDSDLSYVRSIVAEDVETLHFHLFAGKKVVWPADGIGTGRAKLAEKAPAIKQFYDEVLEMLNVNG